MSYWYLFVCLAFFGIGDVLATITKARLSSVFVALCLYLVGFLSKILPANVIDLAGLGQVAKWASAFVVFHMGTMINLRELAREWKTVLLSVLSMLAAMVAIFAAIPLIGKNAAIVSIPIINGGIIATQIMTQAAMDKGLTLAAALGAIVYAVQKFVGTPPASLFGIREAEEIVQRVRRGEAVDYGKSEQTAASKASIYEKYGLSKYYTDYVCLAVTAGFAWLANVLDKPTGINYSIWALLLGATVSHFGLVPSRILEKGKASGFLTMAIFASIVPSLAKISVKDLAVLGYQTAVVFVATLLGIFVFIYLLPLWRIVGSKNLAVGISMAQLLGFPATYLIANEVANAVATNEEEKAAILKRIMPAYVVAGFASVTTLSIVIAGIFAKML